MATKEKKITLGSGKLYCIEFTGTIPAETEIEIETNMLGLIQGGAILEYKPETYTVEDDLGLRKEIYLTKEEVTLKTGTMVWNGNTLSKLCSTARVTEDESKGMRTVKIGGVGNQDKKSYIIHFLYEDKIDGNIRLTIIGKNTAGFSFAFTKDKETVIDVEFAAEPQDEDGTLILYKEEIPKTGGI